MVRPSASLPLSNRAGRFFLFADITAGTIVPRTKIGAWRFQGGTQRIDFSRGRWERLAMVRLRPLPSSRKLSRKRTAGGAEEGHAAQQLWRSGRLFPGIPAATIQALLEKNTGVLRSGPLHPAAIEGMLVFLSGPFVEN